MMESTMNQSHLGTIKAAPRRLWERRFSAVLIPLTVLGCWVALSPSLFGRQPPDAREEVFTPPSSDMAEEGEAVAEGRVDVDPLARDDEIAERLTRILEATEWFEEPEVQVDNGVVFLRAKTDRTQYKEWATKLAQQTQDVAAVVNRIEVKEGPIWDFRPAYSQLIALWRGFVQSLPLIVVGVIILGLTIVAARLASRFAGGVLSHRVQNQLLRDVASKAISIPVLLVGLYIMLHIAGLTRLALTVLGGTGLAGLIIGIAFRDIAENFLASLLISVQNPFQNGDVIKVNEHVGLVQKVTTRGTLLMAFDGTYIQIPNSTIYKNVILNYTANARTRQDFLVGIGYDVSIARAQEVARAALADHAAVLDDPQPMVLVENLGAATVNLRVYFWVDSRPYSPPKVLSSVIRLVKRALTQAGISMPDEAREVVFPNGVPVQMVEQGAHEEGIASTASSKVVGEVESEEIATRAEGDLSSDTEEMQEQARASRQPEEGTDLLKQPINTDDAR